MPKNVLPDAARVLPKAGQSVWLKAFNEALDKGMPEDEASAMGWAAVKRAGYSKDGNGKWSKSMEHDFTMNEDDSFVLSAPLMKVNIQKRTVGGFATLNNVDEARDIVEADASSEAFSKWFGNIREMHDKKAVGKAISWKPSTYTDENGTEYEGIWVEAKISKGAEDTWQKVLDGTLSGFSIGGATLEKQRDIVKDSDGASHQVWRITKYKLTELSLVDSPCNRLATISLIKSVDGNPEFGDTIADEDDIEKAHNGETGEFVNLEGAYKGVVSALEGLRDEAIRNNADHVVSEASDALSRYRSRCRYEKQEAEYYAKSDEVASNESTITKEETVEKNDETLQENGKSDIPVTDGIFSDEEKGILRKLLDFVKGDSTENVETPASKTGVEEETNEEGETPEMKTEDVEKMLTEAGEELSKAVDGKFEQVGESLTKIAEALEKVATAEAVDTLKKELETQVETLTGRIEALETSGAVKKSGDDAGETGETIEKSDEGFWAGALLPDYVVKAN